MIGRMREREEGRREEFSVVGNRKGRPSVICSLAAVPAVAFWALV